VIFPTSFIVFEFLDTRKYLFRFLPDIWLIGSIKPIYKNKGNPLDPKNFRPITILSCLGKLFTAILNERNIFVYYVIFPTSFIVLGVS
jgi:hypothetical protein